MTENEHCVNCGNMLPVDYDNELGLCEYCIEVLTDYWRMDNEMEDEDDGGPKFHHDWWAWESEEGHENG